MTCISEYHIICSKVLGWNLNFIHCVAHPPWCQRRISAALPCWILGQWRFSTQVEWRIWWRARPLRSRQRFRHRLKVGNRCLSCIWIFWCLSNTESVWSGENKLYLLGVYQNNVITPFQGWALRRPLRQTPQIPIRYRFLLEPNQIGSNAPDSKFYHEFFTSPDIGTATDHSVQYWVHCVKIFWGYWLTLILSSIW